MVRVLKICARVVSNYYNEYYYMLETYNIKYLKNKWKGNQQETKKFIINLIGPQRLYVIHHLWWKI